MSIGDLVALPVRLHSGDDLRRALEERVRSSGSEAAFVVKEGPER